MTPQCNNSFHQHYTKQPLISQNRPVSLLTANNTSSSGVGCSCCNSGSASKKKSKNEKQKKKERKIKCVLVGDQCVGKTALAVSYSTDQFPNQYIPTAYDNYNVDVQVNGKPIRVELCDTAGEDELNPLRINPLRNLCYPDTDVFMVCFSIVKPSSFRSAATRWAEEVSKYNAAVVLVGTQEDLSYDAYTIRDLQTKGEKPISPDLAAELAEKLSAPYVATSAKTCSQLKEAFDLAIMMAMRKQFKKKKLWRRLCCL